ncbi:hypothetical protein AAVH_11067 [Aphelenchoides avenae]|nr:hypothetical protein AAVH_11067 [Aphelenchus avenae]
MSTEGAPATSTATGGEIGPNGAKIKELEEDDKNYYVVQRIMGVRHKGGFRDYLIKWVGYVDLEWTPDENCGACEWAIAKFKEDMGWRQLKPWTQEGKWLLPTDKWNFEEGEQIPAEHLPGGSVQEPGPVEPPPEWATSSGAASENSVGPKGSRRKKSATPQHVRNAHVKTGSSQPETHQKAGNKAATSGRAAPAGGKRTGAQLGASSGTASHHAEKRPRLNQKSSLFDGASNGPTPSPSPSTSSSLSATSTDQSTTTDSVTFLVPTAGPSESLPPSRASTRSSPLPSTASNASVSPYPPPADNGAFRAKAHADVGRVPRVLEATEADSEVSLGSNNPLPTATVPAGGFLQTPSTAMLSTAASSSSLPPTTADPVEVCHMLEVDVGVRKKALIDFVIDFRYKKIPEADRVKVKKVLAYEDRIPGIVLMKEDTEFEEFNFTELTKNLAICRGGFSAIDEWFPPLVEQLRPIFERGNGSALQTGEETVRHINKYLKKLRNMSVPINIKLVSAVYNQVLRRVAPHAVADRATIDAMLRRTYFAKTGAA